ncbi:hypothetical protein CPB86DRAFT_788833 [Serendipita vermifera]|nr:hypothetical protein CPB86DRAFT_788833 [Serendipita vermifera]
MASTSFASQGFNSSPTEEEAKRLYSFIDARVEEAWLIGKKLHAENEQLRACNVAISVLETDIPEGRKILAINENNLASLMKIQSHLTEIEASQQEMTKNIPINKAHYHELQGYLKRPISPILTLVNEQIMELTKELRTLWDTVRQLEMELAGWRSSKRLCERSIKRLSTGYEDLKEDLKAAREGLRPIWKVPSDVWAKIFEYSIEEVKAGYLKDNPQNRGMRLPTFNLSQVCQRWRYIVNGEPSLWTFAYIPPTQRWRQDEYDLITDSVKKSRVPITVVTNLYQYFSSGYGPNRFNRSGSVQSSVPTESTLFNAKGYTLLVDMYNDNYDYMQRLSNIPLRQATSLIFSSRSSIGCGYLFSYVSNFSSVKSFSIINDNPSSFPNDTVSSYFPQLRELCIQVKTFPSNFSLRSYLPTTLHELRLRNDNGGSLPNLPSNVELPHLRVLEITSPGSYLLDRLTAKALRSLTLYGPHTYQGTQITLSNKATEIYSQLLHLKFEDWKALETTDGSHGAVPVLMGFVGKTPLIRTLAFSRSFVDGMALLPAIEELMDNSGDQGKPRKLEELTLSYPNGITNSQCEKLMKKVKKVKIHM